MFKKCFFTDEKAKYANAFVMVMPLQSGLTFASYTINVILTAHHFLGNLNSSVFFWQAFPI